MYARPYTHFLPVVSDLCVCRFPKTFMLMREKRAPRRAELFGDLIAKMEQRQQRAHEGALAKTKASMHGESAHGSVPNVESPSLDSPAADKESPDPSVGFWSALNSFFFGGGVSLGASTNASTGSSGSAASADVKVQVMVV